LPKASSVGAKTVYVLMRHTTKDGQPKILDACTYPLTGTRVVSRIYTDLAVIEITPEGPRVIELFGDNSFDDVQAVTGTRLLAPQT